MNTDVFSRRDFLRSAVTAGATTGALAIHKAIGEEPTPAFRNRLQKAVIRPLPDESMLLELKTAGFEGIECTAWNASQSDAETARKAADKTGVHIHSVMRAWTQFNDPNQIDQDITTVETALTTAQTLGADAVLLVPCPGPMPHQKQVNWGRIFTLHILSLRDAGRNAIRDSYKILSRL